MWQHGPRAGDHRRYPLSLARSETTFKPTGRERVSERGSAGRNGWRVGPGEGGERGGGRGAADAPGGAVGPMVESPIRWDPEGRRLRLLDQRRLPAEERWIECRDAAAVAEAIRSLAVRGAPAIGIAAAYGAALGVAGGAPVADPEARLRAAAIADAIHDRPVMDSASATSAVLRAAGSVENRAASSETLHADFEAAAALLAATRPTAVNLTAALERQRRRLRSFLATEARPTPAGAMAALIAEADALAAEEVEANRRIGGLGQSLLPDGAGPVRFLTHCNTGMLATGGYGTALGIVRATAEAGRPVEVFASETRPLLQGARLTAWELQRAGIPVILITDGMVGALLGARRVDAVVVGADRIAANGDTANKIGTYPAAVLAREHEVPFLVAAPFSTVDLATPRGADIPIEEREAGEITAIAGAPVAPPGVGAWNPAFDVTPARLIAAIVTERGIARPPFADSLAALAP